MRQFLIIFTLCTIANPLFFGGGGGCGCRPQQCGCAAPPVCPPSPCARPFSAPQPYFTQYRPPPPPPTLIQSPNYYQLPRQQPVLIPNYQQPLPYNSYQSPLLTSSYNAPPYSTVQNMPIQVSSAKETSETTYPDTVIQKSKTLSNVKNELDEDVSALSNFETSLLAYKSMNRNGIRRAQGAKTEEKVEKCTSPRLREIMEKAMSPNVSISKLKISQGAKREFGYNFDVICSQFDFSYLISSSIHCRVELDGQICLAYEN